MILTAIIAVGVLVAFVVASYAYDKFLHNWLDMRWRWGYTSAIIEMHRKCTRQMQRGNRAAADALYDAARVIDERRDIAFAEAMDRVQR